MRSVTREEATAWTALAAEHGYTDDDGNITAMGRFTVLDVDDRTNIITVGVVTPIIAGRYTGATLERKLPPIMFDRTDDGRIILPGRWIHALFEGAAESPDLDERSADAAATMARTAVIPDVHLPADFDTICFHVDDEEGELVEHEALPPGGQIHFALRPRASKRA